MTKVAIAQRREQIRQLFSEREREGISLAAVSRRSGIAQSTLAGWSTRFRSVRVDFRKGNDGLCAIIREAFSEHPLSGHLYLLFNAKLDRLKILV